MNEALILDSRSSYERKDSQCTSYDIEEKGNYYQAAGEITLKAEGRDFQWLGGSMDGGTRDTDKLLVCAPRFYSLQEEVEDGWLDEPVPENEKKQISMIGNCYTVTNTLKLRRGSGLDPFMSKNKQTRRLENNETEPLYQMGELGLSAHVTKESTFLMGAPGIDVFRGTVFLKKTNESIGTKSSSQRRKREVSEPEKWGQEEGSYFGYAVSSGNFDTSKPNNLLYVGTAPHANHKSGEAYIFEYRDLETNIRKLYVFNGTKFGEYFGYSVLAEDLNGDGEMDLIISAPQYFPDEFSHDNGAIYVFINKGSLEFDRTIIHSPAGNKGRFGTTLSPIGDINRDGYNDVAVGAPFAGNGAVFIYLGSKHGLREEPSQRIDAPLYHTSKFGLNLPMFGHGLSRGLDIDENGFNDFAIGAPNEEAVYVYQAYPVVKVIATVEPTTHRVEPEQDKLNITVCYQLTTLSTVENVQKQELDIRIELGTEKHLKNRQAAYNSITWIYFSDTAGLEKNCTEFEIEMSPEAKFDNITMKMHYELKNKIPENKDKPITDFCEKCAVLDPSEPNFSTGNITFGTGCSNDICVADLQLRISNKSSEFILGSSNTLRLRYDIINDGENAYQPQFEVISTPRLNFSQIPANCKCDEGVMLCELNNGFRLTKSNSTHVEVLFDVSELKGQSLTINATVFSALGEMTPKDNNIITVINLKEKSEIDVFGAQTNDQLVLKKDPYIAELINHYEIKSFGPSTIENVNVSLYIPIGYKKSDSKSIPIMDISSLKVEADYNDSRPLTIELFDQYNRKNTLSTSRKRRNVESLNGVKEDNNSSIPQVQTNDRLLEEDLPKDNTIVLNCQDTNKTVCVRIDIGLDLKPHKIINLNVRFNVDLNKVDDSWEYFVIQTNMSLVKKGDSSSCSFTVNKKITSNVICKHAEVSIWKIVLAVIGGVVLLGAIAYTLYKRGFFQRKVKYELAKYIRESFEEGMAAAERRELEKDGNPGADPDAEVDVHAEAENLMPGDSN
nr:integrin alpha-PS4-like [Drosophila takahashii]